MRREAGRQGPGLQVLVLPVGGVSERGHRREADGMPERDRELDCEPSAPVEHLWSEEELGDGLESF